MSNNLALITCLLSFTLLVTSTHASYQPFTRAGNSVILSRVFSEEIEGGYSGRMSGPVAGIKCFGDYCDNKQLISVQRNGQTAVSFTNFFTGFFSEESPSFASCPYDQVLVEIQCRGDYCDDMRLHCARMARGYRLRKFVSAVVDFFSEEQGEGLCPDGSYVYAIECRGDYCDDLKLHCALVEFDPSVTDSN